MSMKTAVAYDVLLLFTSGARDMNAITGNSTSRP